MKVLIVDDNKNNRILLSKILSSHGCEKLEAVNGIEAIKLIREEKPALIISDILMPRMDGFALLRKLKMDETTRDIPFVFYTAHYVGEKDRELALKLGASRFIVKPVDPKDLMREIKTVLMEYESGGIKPAEPLLRTEEEYLRHYSDLIARKLEEKFAELENTKNFLDAVLENMDDGVMATDAYHNVLYCNRKMHEMVQCDNEPGIPECTHTPCIPDMAHSSHQVFEVDQETKKGSIVHLEGIISEIKTEKGEPTEIGVFRDISQRIKDRAEIDRKNKEISLLSDIDKIFFECENVTYFLDTILSRMIEILDVEGGCVYLMNEKNTGMQICRGMPEKFVELAQTRSFTIMNILKEGARVTIMPLSSRISGIEKVDQEYVIPRIITVQIRSKKKNLGFIDLIASPYRNIDDYEIKLLEKIGMHLGVVLENSLSNKKAINNK